MNVDSLIFDLDGTLWDAAENVVISWNETLHNYDEIQRPLTIQDMKGVMGLRIEDVALRFFPYLETERRMEIVHRCCWEECDYLEKHGGVLFDGVEETVRALSLRYQLFIVSNCPCGYIESFLSFHKLGGFFADHECAGNTGLSKGENIELIIARNHLSHPVYIGDTQGDCDSARFARIPFVYAAYGFGEVTDYDYRIENFSELLEPMQ